MGKNLQMPKQKPLINPFHHTENVVITCLCWVKASKELALITHFWLKLLQVLSAVLDGANARSNKALR
jgi:hypothetical protein